jgi:CheY-like chemotaxis protein
MSTDSIDSSRRLLIADDDSDVCRTLQDRLEAYGFCGAVAVDGAAALALLEAERFDGQILEIGLPQMDGTKVLRASRHHMPLLPVLVISASVACIQAMKHSSPQPNGDLLKPFTTTEFKTALTHCVGQQRIT